LSGPIDQPSPITSSVTPWRMSPCERPSLFVRFQHRRQLGRVGIVDPDPGHP
jgi:hypothetical protein